MGLFDGLVGAFEIGAGTVTGYAPLVAAGTAKVGSAAIGALSPGNSKDAERAAAAKDHLAKALGGSVPDALFMIGQRFGSATAYGKQQYEIAWSALEQQNPAIAQEALKQYPNQDPVNTPPAVKSKLAQELDSLVAKLKNAVATSVQNIGSGATTAAATAIDPNTGRVTLPLSSKMIWVAAFVVLVIVAVVLFKKRG